MSVPQRTDIPVLLLHNVDPQWEADEVNEAQCHAALLSAALRQEGHPVTDLPVTHSDLAAILADHDPSESIVLNWCEELSGLPRSEARVAQILEERNFAFTGSPANVLARSWDKAGVKRLLDSRGIPTPRWRVCESADISSWNCFPAIAKPAWEHCSYGITAEAVALGPRDLRQRVAYLLEAFRQPVLVEDFIDGREFHISLLGNGQVHVLPPAEMVFPFDDIRQRLCTFEAKFRPGSVPYEEIDVRLPATLPTSLHRRLERIALLAYHALGCRDYARLDIRLRDGAFYVLDVNPNPDLSPDTSTVEAAAHYGYSYGAMASRLVNLAAHRHPRFSRAHF